MQEHAEQVWEQGPCSTNDRDKGDGADGDEWYYRNAGLGQEGLNAPRGTPRCRTERSMCSGQRWRRGQPRTSLRAHGASSQALRRRAAPIRPLPLPA